MIALSVALPIFAPLLGGLGYLLESGWMFWTGVLLAGVSRALDSRAGMFLLPIPVLLGAITIGALVLGPWYVGAGAGLIAVVAVGAALMLGQAASGR